MKKIKFSKNRVDGQISGEKKTQNKSRIGLFIVGGLVLIMIISVFTIGLGSEVQNEKLEYNGFELFNNGGLWMIKGTQYGFEYGPNDLENIPSIDLGVEPLIGKIYMVFDPDEFSTDSREILRIRQFLTSKGVISSSACIKEEGCEDIPIIKCNETNKIIYLKNGNETKIYKDDNCIILESKIGEEPLVINRFMYGVLGVMQND